MRGKAPAKCKGFRELFKNAGYKVYLVDEYSTSKRCHNCKAENEKFKYNISKRPRTKGQRILVHGLLRCKSPTCSTM